MHHHFSIDESLRFGWQKTKAHSRLLFQVLLTFFAVQVSSAVVSRVLGHTLLGIAATIVLTICSIFLGVGLTVIVLKLARGERASYSDLMPKGELVWRFFIAGLLSGIFMAIGLVLLIIPGVYLMLRYSMVRFAVIDGASITESLRKSAELTQGVKWHLLGFVLIIIALNIIGALLLLVGLLVTIPVTMLAYAHVYQKLLGRTHHAGA
ncbi:MAG TPA: hypothetical protein VIJ88_01310 [Candidatus Paceibacterota bacterium]